MATKSLRQVSLEKLPPHNLDAEQAVLCAILLNNDALFTISTSLSAQDFYKPAHSKIYTACLAIQDRGDAIDLLTLRDELERRKQLDEVGDIPYLMRLSDAFPTAANVEFHQNIVLEKSLARRLLNIGIEIATTCYEDATPPHETLAMARQRLIEMRDGRESVTAVPLKTAIQKAFERFEAYREQQDAPSDDVWSGFADIDRITMGFHPGNLIVVAARPGCGKTAFACDLLRKATQRKIVDGKVQSVPVSAVLYSLEMTEEELSDRLLCAEAKVSAYDVKNNQLADDHWTRLTYAAESLSRCHSFIVDPSSMTITALRAHAKRMKLEHNIGMVLIDYTQLVLASTNKENRVQEISEVSRGLKALAKELHVPVIALAQLNREVEKRPDKKPQLSDLRDSGQIEQDSDVVMFPFRPELYFDDAEKGLAEMILAKHRHGAVGSVRLRFFSEFACFESYTPRHENPFQPYDEL